MANNYFQFKQFTIHQEECAMKVTTDACILGAWFAEKVRPFSYILDIGAGTGLLMLMMAQKVRGVIHGIEIDLAAFKQLKENINHCNWKDKIKIMIGDVRYFTFSDCYDFIITNPPFYENDLTSSDEQINMARHSSHLTLDELLEVIQRNLKDDGSFGILLPARRVKEFIEKAELAGFFLSEKLMIRQTPRHEHFRGVLQFTRILVSPVQELELIIQDQQGEYTEEFRELLKDYYLKL